LTCFLIDVIEVNLFEMYRPYLAVAVLFQTPLPRGIGMDKIEIFAQCRAYGPLTERLVIVQGKN